ncbi:MAG: superoxide dismutase [Arcobacteraceae bacterium]
MKHELINLPYAYDALAPFMSKETLEYHHGKHHQTYVNKLNELIAGTKFESMTLDEIIKNSDGGIFNNAAQVYNHDVFFQGLSGTKTEISPDVSKLIVDTFGSVDQFKTNIIAKATGNFGSGWVWLVLNDNGSLEIIPTSNAATPIVDGKYPLLVVDVWEHAYYIDYRNQRPVYLENWWNVINWDVVDQRCKAKNI